MTAENLKPFDEYIRTSVGARPKNEIRLPMNAEQRLIVIFSEFEPMT